MSQHFYAILTDSHCFLCFSLLFLLILFSVSVHHRSMGIVRMMASPAGQPLNFPVDPHRMALNGFQWPRTEPEERTIGKDNRVDKIK